MASTAETTFSCVSSAIDGVEQIADGAGRLRADGAGATPKRDYALPVPRADLQQFAGDAGVVGARTADTAGRSTAPSTTGSRERRT